MSVNYHAVIDLLSTIGLNGGIGATIGGLYGLLPSSAKTREEKVKRFLTSMAVGGTFGGIRGTFAYFRPDPKQISIKVPEEKDAPKEHQSPSSEPKKTKEPIRGPVDISENKTNTTKTAAKTDVEFWNNDVPVQVKGLGGTEYLEDTPDGYDFQLHPQGGDQLFRETYGKGKHWNSTQKGSAVSILLSGLLGAGVGAGALAGLGQLAKATGIENKDKSIMPLALAGGLFGGLYGSLGAGAAVANGKTRGRYEDALRTPKEQKKYNESSTLKEWLVPGEAARQNQRNGRYALWAESKHPYRYTVTGKDPGYTQDSLEEALKSKDYKTRHAAENFMENLAAVSMADDTEQRILAENLVNKYYGGDVDFRDPQNLYEYIHAQPYEMDDYNNEPLDKWKRIIIEKMFTGEPAAIKNRSLKMYRRYG